MFVQRQLNIALIGFAGSGKTTLGRCLAQVLNRPFVDTDQLVQHYHPSLSCREIFKSFGEDYFRYLESQGIFSLENQKEGLIIATGGGSLLKEDNGLSLKKHSVLIYLKTSPLLLKERLWNQDTFPAYLHGKDPEHMFAALHAERSALYEKWMDKTVEIASSDFCQTLKDLQKAIGVLNEGWDGVK